MASLTLFFVCVCCYTLHLCLMVVYTKRLKRRTVEPSNSDTNGTETSVIVSEVSSFQRLARVVLGVRKGVLFGEVSSFKELVFLERGSTVDVHTLLCCMVYICILLYICQYTQ